MNRCPITYELCNGQYSQKGLKLLSRSLNHLNLFPYSSKEQVTIAQQMASKLSIQGVQPKLSVSLSVKEANFVIVSRSGKFIIKPPHQQYDEVPQNEDLTMRLAKIVDIEVPLHGMIYNIDGSLSYFIKRFDRTKGKKIAVEDFSQLLGYSRDTKYESSMEQVTSVLEKHCSFPLLEKTKLFRLVIFNFLVGNEDSHLKNFSLIESHHEVRLSPAYDLLNTTILLKAKEEIALPIAGRKTKLTRENLIDYFGIERLKLPESIINSELLRFAKALPKWDKLISDSFLSSEMQDKYKQLIKKRWERIHLTL